MTVSEARERLPYWQQRLGLTDWRIAVFRGIPTEEEYPDDWNKHELPPRTIASSNWHTEDGVAIILLRKDAEEDSLVHELLHIRLEGHSMRSRAYSELYERGLNEITAALMGRKKLTTACI